MKEESRKSSETLTSVLTCNDIHDADLFHSAECKSYKQNDQEEDSKCSDQRCYDHRHHFRLKQIEC